MLPRYYQDLNNYLEPGRVLVIFGPRQVGKTTLLEAFLEDTDLKYKLDSGDNIRTQQVLESQDFKKIKEYVSGYDLLAIDEAQNIPNVGVGLKIVADQIPEIRVVATGSSSFELSGQIGEPLTGRKRTLALFPMAQIELSNLFNAYELKEQLSERLVFGSYPEVVTANSRDEKIKVLNELVDSYLLKDILVFEEVKSSKILIDLLRLLAFQVGSEVSLSELGTKLGINYKTVARYLDLLEKTFVIFNLRGFSRNLRKEITKKSKYYFLDNGILNAIISNFNDLEVRNDIGRLWENYIVTERLKKQEYKGVHANNYFWRTYDQKEIDWVEEREGKLFGYEIKWSPEVKVKAPSDWVETYSEAEFEIINRENYLDFVV